MFLYCICVSPAVKWIKASEFCHCRDISMLGVILKLKITAEDRKVPALLFDRCCACSEIQTHDIINKWTNHYSVWYA